MRKGRRCTFRPKISIQHFTPDHCRDIRASAAAAKSLRLSSVLFVGADLVSTGMEEKVRLLCLKTQSLQN